MLHFKHKSDTEFEVEGYTVYQDGNGKWICYPEPKTDRIKEAIQTHIKNL